MKDGFFNTLSRRVRAPLNRRWAFQRLQEYHSVPRSLKETVQWAMRFGGKGFFRVGTLQVESEILRLAERVQQLKPRLILELGTARAGTLLIWSALASDRVITCDLRDLSISRELFEALPLPGSKCRVQLLTGDSHSPAFRQRVAETLAGQKADFLFIDGDHSVAGVTQDYQDYKAFVRPGGLIAFHDIVERQVLPTNQVFHFWKTIRSELDTEEIVADANQSGFGIGVVRVPEQSNREA